VAKILHIALIRAFGTTQEKQKPYYRYTPETTMERNGIKVYWDRTLRTDREVGSNRPGIVVVDKVNKKAYIIEIAIPHVHNIQTVYEEKMRKYEALDREMKRIWEVERIKTYPIIISSTGHIHSKLLTNLEEIGVRKEVFKKMQKAVIIGTCGIVREVLSSD